MVQMHSVIPPFISLFNSLHAGQFLHAFVVRRTFFKMNFFQKKSFNNTIRVSNVFDPGQDQHSVGPDLGPNCLQQLSADDKVAASKEKVKL